MLHSQVNIPYNRKSLNGEKAWLFLFLYLLVPHFLTAQAKAVMTGYISDGESGEVMIGATVYAEPVQSGCITNSYGWYSLTLDTGVYSVRFSYTGYQTVLKEVSLHRDMKMDIELKPATALLRELVITACDSAGKNLVSTQTGLIRMDVKESRKIPVIFSEPDILKTLQLLPGVHSAGDGNSGYYVRGGSSDQNLILVDEAPVYNPGHLLGFFSVFNSDALSDVQLYKGAIPANYGGRISSVLDVHTRDGNMKSFHATGGAGLISSRMTVEGPLVQEKCSALLSARRTYGDLFLPIMNDSVLSNTRLYFYDLNTKINYIINPVNRLFLSVYTGRDYFKSAGNFRIDWGNITASLRWNHLFNNRLFLNSSLIFSDYDYIVETGGSANGFQLESGTGSLTLKPEFQYFLSPKTTLKFGCQVSRNHFSPVCIETNNTGNLPARSEPAKQVLEAATYFNAEHKANDKLTFQTGVRLSASSLLGPGEFILFDGNGNATDTAIFRNFSLAMIYPGYEPRYSMSYLTGPASSVKVSYTKTIQYMHLLSNSTSSKPTDVWIPCSMNVRPQESRQISAGYFRDFANHMFETSAEVFWKNMNNQIDYRSGANILTTANLESLLVFGKGQAYGIELLVRKTTGKLTGWIGYSLSRSVRRFPQIDNGDVFPARQDRIHDLSVVSVWNFHPAWSASGSWVYYTGEAVTFPSGKYVIDRQFVYLYGERNGSRMPGFHRLDLSLTWQRENRGGWESSWIFSVYNVYGRENAFIIDFQQNENDQYQSESVQLSLFKTIPSIAWQFRF